MEEDGGESSTPFWVQGNSGLRRGDRLRRRFESAVFSSGILVFILLVAAVFFLAFIVPKTVSFSSSVFRPSSVKKSWDSVNVVLVFLAIIFGILSRGKNELQKSNPATPVWYGYRDEVRRSNPSAFDRWVESSDRRSFNGGLRRTFSSYPDLCEMSPRWVSADDQWRFYDDTRVDASRVYDSCQLFRRRSWREVDRIPEAESNKNVYVDSAVMGRPIMEAKEAPPPAPSSPPPPPPPQEAAAAEPVYEDKDKLTYESLGTKRKTRARKKRDHDVEAEKPKTPPAPAASPPPPPPPPPPLPHYVEPKSSKSERKRGSTSATKGFIISTLYHKRKRKHRSQSVDNLDALLHTSQPPPLHFQFPPPPPPPPSVFHNLFSSKKSKRKKNAIATPTSGAPPPPPPPPPTTANPRRRTSRPTAEAPTVSRHRAEERRSVEIVDEKPNLGGESPLIPIPPPPPPPPFFKKSAAWKFVVQGDYVRVDSLVSSRSGSPDPDDLDSDVTPTASEGGGDRTPFPPSPLFCPSPDVNTKAENFISKFRAGLKLEKMNSMKRQGLGLSNLGPTPT